MTRAYTWTERKRRLVRERYGRDTLPELARKTGIPVGPVWRMADRMGLVRHLPKRPGLHRYIKQKHAAQWSDTEIANGWNRAHPQARTCRQTIRKIRKSLCLPGHGWTARRLRHHRAAMRRWLVSRGYRSMGDMRANSLGGFAASRGWPAHLRPRHAQVLDFLWEHGPATRWEIAEAIGMTTKRGQRYLLGYNSRVRETRGSYLSDLLAQGLVERSEGRMVQTGPTKYHKVYLYWIAPGVERGRQTA